MDWLFPSYYYLYVLTINGVWVAKLKLKLYYDRPSVGQSVFVSGTHLGPTTNVPFSLTFSLDSCGFIIS
jgi:hypothetical protein